MCQIKYSGNGQTKKTQKQLNTQGSVADSKLNPSYKNFFLHPKQKNMDLVEDEYNNAVQKY